MRRRYQNHHAEIYRGDSALQRRWYLDRVWIDLGNVAPLGWQRWFLYGDELV